MNEDDTAKPGLRRRAEEELEIQNEELRRIRGVLEKTRDRFSHLYDFAPEDYIL